LVYVKKDSVKILHQLHDGHICEKSSSLQDYQILRGKYVQRVIDTLNDWLPILHIFNVAKLFNPRWSWSHL